MSNALAVTLLPSGAQIVSGNGSAIDLVDVDSGLPLRTTMVLRVDVDVVTGTLPLLTVNIETSDSATGPWRVIGTLNQTLTELGADTYRLLVGDCEQFVRVAWIIAGGTPSFTFGVAGEAHVTYANREDMVNYGMSSHVLDQLTEEMKLQALIAASATMSTNLSVSFTLPITAWGEDITMHTAILAVWVAVAGNFREGIDQTLIDLKDETMDFLKILGSGKLRPKTITDATPDVEEDSVVTASRSARNWNVP